MEELKHSPLGASSMYRWKNCPGSVKLSEGVKKISSSYAEEGTKAHEIAAQVLLSGKWPVGLDPETQNAIHIYVDDVLKVKKSGDFTLLVEQKVDLKEVHPLLYGTSDALLYSKTKKILYVYDYKHGAGITVDVESNEQLMYYAAGALLSTGYPCEKVVLKIVQPRAYHEDGAIRSWQFDSFELLDFVADLKMYAENTQKPNAPIKTGEWCRFCPAAGFCPKLKEQATELAKQDFSPALPYDSQKLAHTLTILPMLESFAKAVREFAYSEAVQGRCPPGFKLVEKRAVRKWKDEAEVSKTINSRFNGNFAREFFTSPELKSVAQVEKIAGKDFSLLEHLVTKESSGTTLVEAIDKRPEIKLDAVSEFTRIAEQELLT